MTEVLAAVDTSGIKPCLQKLKGSGGSLAEIPDRNMGGVQRTLYATKLCRPDWSSFYGIGGCRDLTGSGVIRDFGQDFLLTTATRWFARSTSPDQPITCYEGWFMSIVNVFEVVAKA